MQKLEKIILQCLVDLEEGGHLDNLESQGSAAKLICKTVKKVVSTSKQIGLVNSPDKGGK